jgi:hypothetical protein
MPETTHQYKQRVLSYTEGLDPLAVQAATPKKIARLLAHASPAKTRRSPAPGKWSAAEILAHLADCEVAFAWRYRSILGQPGAPLIGFDQEAWARQMRYAKRAAKPSCEAFAALRAFNLALLKSLTPAEWKLEGLHSERGPESVATTARMVAGHDLNHLRQLEALLK